MKARDACRLFRHRWTLVSGDWTPMAGVPVTQICDRCGTEKRQAYGTNTGELITQRYIYPPEYSYTQDEKPTSDELRLMYVREQVSKLRKDRQKA